MRKCKGTYATYNKEKRMYETHGFEEGLFHQWGVEYEEINDYGVGNYSVAIVELSNGEIVMPFASNIQFLDSADREIGGDEV